jgi:hypothetical protein
MVRNFQAGAVHDAIQGLNKPAGLNYFNPAVEN